MNALHVGRTVLAASVLVLSAAPVASIAEAQSAPTTTCVIATRALTPDEESMVNDYEVQVARANSKHTAIPLMPEPVFALIGCESPAEQTGVTASGAPASTAAPAAAPATTPGFACPVDGLSKEQQSMINDFEILVARANSKHTPVPTASEDVANLLSCG